MFRKFIATALIITQTLTPALAANSQFYYRYTHAVVDASVNTPSDPNGGSPDQTKQDIPTSSLQALVGNASYSPLTSQSTSEAISSVQGYLVGGTAAVVFDGSSPVLPGLNFDVSSGKLSGIPTSEFQGNITIFYHDGANRRGKLIVPVSIYAQPAIASSQDTFEVPVQADASNYNIVFKTTNDAFPNGISYKLAPTSDQLPNGMSLLPAGIISGSPQTSSGQKFNIVVRGYDPTNPSLFADKSISLSVTPSVSMSLDVPDAPLVWQFDSSTNTVLVQEKFTPAPSVKGTFKAPISWSLLNNPGWMGIDSDGQLTGTPSDIGSFRTIVQAKDADGNVASDTATVNVITPGYLTLAPGSQIITVRTGETWATSAQSVSGNTGAYQFSSEIYPSSVAFSTTTGVYSGRFDTAGKYGWKFHVSDSAGHTDADGVLPNSSYTASVTAFPALTQGPAISAVGGTQYSATPSLSVSWPQPSNLIGKATYAIAGEVPGTLFYKIYTNDDPTSAFSFVGENGAVFASEALLPSSHLIFDTVFLTLRGIPSKSGTFKFALFVSDNHQTTGYKENSNDPTRISANEATSSETTVSVKEHSFYATNTKGDSETVAQFTGVPTLSTQLFDSLTAKPYTNNVQWKLVSGTLPPGISSKISDDTSTLSYVGYPTALGVYSGIVWQATDANGAASNTTPVTLTVGPRSDLQLSATPSPVKSMRLGIDDAHTVVSAAKTAGGLNIPDGGWVVTGVLPTGVTYAPTAEGLVFSGKAAQSGTFTDIVVTATDTQGGTANITLTFNVNATFTLANIGDAAQKLTQYTSLPNLSTDARSASNNTHLTTPGTEWVLKSGTLPPGITTTISPDSNTLTYTGYPTTQGTYDGIVWQVTDSSGNVSFSSPVSFSVGNRAPLTLSASNGGQTNVNTGTAVNVVVSATNLPFGQILAPSDWAVTGDLPPGVTSAATGNTLTFSGVTTLAGTYGPISVTVADQTGATKTLSMSFNIGKGFYAQNYYGNTQVVSQYQGTITAMVVLQSDPDNVYQKRNMTWSLLSGSLPAGVTATVSADTDSLSYLGSPTETGTFDNIVWQIVDPNGTSVITTPIKIVVKALPNLVLTSSSGPTMSAMSGRDAMSTTITASGMAFGLPVSASNWTVSGTLPAGITAVPSDNSITISGFSLDGGTFPLTITATDSVGTKGSYALTIYLVVEVSTVNTNGDSETLTQYSQAPTLITSSFQFGNVYGLAGRWTLVSGTLPPGISVQFTSYGLKYVGRATAVGTFDNIVWRLTAGDGAITLTKPVSFTVTPRDGLVLSSSSGSDYSIRVGDTPNLTVAPTNLPPGTALGAANYTVTGTLPPGMSYAVQNNVLSFTGSPTTRGVYPNIVVSANDGKGDVGSVASTTVAITVTTPLAATNSQNSQTLSASTSKATVSTALVNGLTGSNYTAGATWTLLSGTVPPGVTATLSADQSTLTYKGYPTTEGTYSNIVWQVRSSDGGQVQTNPLTFVVTPRASLTLSANTGTTQSTVTGVAANLTVSALNTPNGESIATGNWTVSGALPNGMVATPDSSGLVFSGSTNVTGIYPISISATDSLGATANLTVTFKVGTPVSFLYLKGTSGTVAQYTGTVQQYINVRGAGNFQYTDGGTFNLVSGTLPPGLALGSNPDASAAFFTGYPTQQGTWSGIVVTLTDPYGNVITSAPFTITVSGRDALALTPSNTTIGVNVAGSTTTTVVATNAAGGTLSNDNWSLTGTLPPGINATVSGNVATFSGSPTKVGTYAVTVAATDSIGGNDSKTLTFTVSNSFSASNTLSAESLSQYTSQPTIQTTVRTKSNNALFTAGTWALTAGALPPGVTASLSTDKSSLTYKGYPTATGTFNNIVWTVTDVYGNQVNTDPVTFTVGPRVALAVNASPGLVNVGVNGVAITPVTVTAANMSYGTAINPSDWSVTGTLPTGITYTTASSGVTFSGTPTVSGSFPSIIVTARDSVGGTASASLTFNISTNISFVYTGGMSATVAQDTGQVTNFINVRKASDGTAYSGGGSFSLRSGTLPPGLSVVTGGQLFGGYPTAAGTYSNIVVQFTDLYGTVTVSQPYSITVTARAALTLTSSVGTSQSVATGAAINAKVTPSNLAGGIPISSSDWNISGALPSGVTATANSSGLTISGSTNTAGTFPLTISATDSAGGSASVTITLTISTGISISYNNGTSQSVAAYTGQSTMSITMKNASNATYTGGGSFSIDSGSLPTGITLVGATDGSGATFSGYPTTTGTYSNVIVKFTDPYGNVLRSSPYSFTVTPRPAFTLSSNVGATRTIAQNVDDAGVTITASNLAYGQALTSSSWTVGALPANLTATAGANLVIAGKTTAAAGTYSVPVTATDGSGATASFTVTFTVNAPVAGFLIRFINSGGQSLSPPTMTQQISNANWTVQARNKKSVSDLYPNLNWSIGSGALPPGLRVDFSSSGYGQFSGYAQVAGTYTVNFRAVDPTTGAYADSGDLVITVTARTFTVTPKVSSVTLGSGKAMTANAVYATAAPIPNGGTASPSTLSWTVTGLPPGITTAVNASGAIVYSGSSTALGTYNTIATATDSTGTSASTTITIIIQ